MGSLQSELEKLPKSLPLDSAFASVGETLITFNVPNRPQDVSTSLGILSITDHGDNAVSFVIGAGKGRSRWTQGDYGWRTTISYVAPESVQGGFFQLNEIHEFSNGQMKLTGVRTRDRRRVNRSPAAPVADMDSLRDAVKLINAYARATQCCQLVVEDNQLAVHIAIG